MVNSFSITLLICESIFSLGNAPNCTLLVSADSKSLGVKNFWSQVDVKIDELKSTANKEYPKTSGDDMHMLAPDGYFPVVLFSYCDLMELSDSVIAGTCLLRRDSIFVFAPQCIQGKKNFLFLQISNTNKHDRTIR